MKPLIENGRLYIAMPPLYKLDYPNDEVRKGFVSLVGNSYFHKPSEDNDNWILEMDDMLRECDLDGVRDAFTSFLASIPYEANKDEIKIYDFWPKRSGQNVIYYKDAELHKIHPNNRVYKAETNMKFFPLNVDNISQYLEPRQPRKLGCRG